MLAKLTRAALKTRRDAMIIYILDNGTSSRAFGFMMKAGRHPANTAAIKIKIGKASKFRMDDPTKGNQQALKLKYNYYGNLTLCGGKCRRY